MHFIQLYSKWQYSDRRRAVYSIFLLSLTCLLNLLISGFITNTYAATIIGAEYFIDTDPGEGLGMPISPPEGGAFDSTMEEMEFVVDTSALKIGRHTVYVRMKNSDGVWGVARPIPNDLELAAPYNFNVEGNKTIIAAEYFFDTDPGPGNGDPGPGNGIPIPLPADGEFDSWGEDLEFSLDTSALPVGLQTLYIRTKDNNGEWGVLRQYIFEVKEPNRILAAEYYMDTDQGPSKGIQLTPVDGFFDSTSETASATLNTALLSAGGHAVYVRMRDGTGWGPVVSWNLGINAPAVSFSAQPAQNAGSGGDVPFSVLVEDHAGGEYRMRVEYSTDGINWKKATLSGALVDNAQAFQVGPIATASSVSLSLTWQSSADLPNQEHASVALRLTIDNGVGRVAETISSNFPIDNLAPPVPLLITPPNGSETKNPTPLFAWQAVEKGVTYHLQVDNQADFSSPEVNMDTANNFFVPVFFLIPGHYFWRVKVTDTMGNGSAYSDIADFLLQSDFIGPAVSLSYSANPAGAGSLAIVATFSEPVTTIPTIAIDQAGTIDLSHTAMIGSGNVWVYLYEVHRADGSAHIDGLARVTIANGKDAAGNTNQPATNDTFMIATGQPAGTIIAAEYFIDTDLGEGLGVTIPAPTDGEYNSAKEQVQFSIDTSRLNIGRHTAYVRMKNADGVWGVARPIPNDMDLAAPYNLTVEGTKTITAAEYFMDTDPGAGNGTPIPMPLDGVYDGGIEDLAIPDIDTSILSAGLHTVYVRARDSNGDWGVLRQYTFEVSSPNVILGGKVALDADPILEESNLVDDFSAGEAWSENQITGSANNGIYNAALTSTADSYFYKNTPDFAASLNYLVIHYRSYTNGPNAIQLFYTDSVDCTTWNSICAQSFPIIRDSAWHTLTTQVSDPEWVDNDGAITQLRFDLEGATATGTFSVDEIYFANQPMSKPLTALDGGFDENIEDGKSSLDTTELGNGGHRLYVRMRDKTGYGPVAIHSLGVTVPAVQITSQPVQAPGSGGDIPFTALVEDYAGGEYRLKVEYSTNETNWRKATLTGALVDNAQAFQVGPIAIASSVNLPLTWQSATDLANQEHASVVLRLALDNGTGRVAEAISTVFSVDNKAPLAPVLIYPIDHFETGDLTPLFIWQAMELFVTHHLQVDNQADFSSPEIDAASLGSNSLISSIPLTPGRYFWRVKATDVMGNQGSFSSPSDFLILSDTIRPEVSLSYSSNPATVGPLVITATFEEPIMTVPTLEIDQQGKKDIAPTPMRGSGNMWIYVYEVHKATGNNSEVDEYVDGMARVTIANGKDDAGNENQPATNDTFVIATGQPSGTIIAAEYFIDTDPGEGLGIPIPSSVDGAYDSAKEQVEFTIDINDHDLKIGRHTVYVRMKNADGVWGIARPIPNDLELAAPFNLTVEGTKTITAAEYFIDTDPGAGRGIPIPVPVDGTFDGGIEDLEVPLNTTDLSVGLHTIYVRAKDNARDNNGEWGIIRQYTFEVSEPYTAPIADKIRAAQYFIQGTEIRSTMTPIDGTFDESTEEVSANLNTLNLMAGIYSLCVQMQDGTGWNWPECTALNVTDGNLKSIINENFGMNYDPSRWYLAGNASRNSGSENLFLTTTADQQRGRAYYKTPFYAGRFRAEFDYNIYGGSGADGLSFAWVQVYNYPASSGEWEDFNGASGYAVEFDTYNNGVDPGGRHIGVLKDNAHNHLNTALFETRGSHHVIVDFNFGRILVSVDGIQKIDYTIPNYTPFDAFFGFTAATYTYTDNHVVDNFRLNILEADSDNDGLNDSQETQLGTNPNNSDTDNDGLPDGWELTNGTDPLVNDANADPDGDGFTNIQEYRAGTNPQDQTSKPATITLHGRIEYVPVETGCWRFRTNDGMTYELTGPLVKDIKQNPNAATRGLTITGNVITGYMSICMVAQGFFEVASFRFDSVELIPDAQPISIGGSTKLTLKLDNTATTAETFTLALTGLDPSWYTLEKSSVRLNPGERVELAIQIHLPEDCNISPRDYPFTISASSAATGTVKVEGILTVLRDPILTELLPVDGEKSASNRLLISWKTDSPATSAIYYRAEGEADYLTASGDPGTDHRVLIDNLRWNTKYLWYVESQSACGRSTSAIQSSTIMTGVVFSQDEYTFSINRDYDQRVSVEIRNLDTNPHSVVLEVLDPQDELIFGFIGAGSPEEPLTLEGGSTGNVTLALHAQDANQSEYALRLRVTADGETANSIVDYATARVTVRQPVFQMALMELSRDSGTLINRYRLTNLGDPITDLQVYVDDVAKNQVLFDPAINHGFLGNGESVEFSASANGSLATPIYAGGAGKRISNTAVFGCGSGRQEVTVEVPDATICKRVRDWYCTNRPQIDVGFTLPGGITPEDVTRSGVFTSFHPGPDARPHYVNLSLNGKDIGTVGGSFIPRGEYAFPYPPSFLNLGGVGANSNNLHLKGTFSPGHFAAITEFLFPITLNSFSVTVCAADQAEAEELARQKVAQMGCGKEPPEPCPRITNVSITDANGGGFKHGDEVIIRVDLMNPDTAERGGSLEVFADDPDDYQESAAILGQTVALAPEETRTLSIRWRIPSGGGASSYTIRAIFRDGNCLSDTDTRYQIQLSDVEIRGGVFNISVDQRPEPLEGVKIQVNDGGFVESLPDGTFSLIVPRGEMRLSATKEGFYPWASMLNVSGPMSMVILMDSESKTFGEGNGSHPEYAEPVNTATGNYYYSHRDLRIQGRGLDFEFVRYYNSRDPYKGPLGYDWTHNWNITVMENASGRARVKYGDGHEEFYALDGTGGYVAAGGVYSTLRKNSDNTYSITTKDQREYHFDIAGRLERVTDRNGNAILIQRDSGGNLIEVQDASGRKILFTYDGSDRILSMTDPLGRIIAYSYDASGNLTSVTDARGNATGYAYDAGHQLLSVIDPRGNRIVENTYDPQNRIVTVQRDAIGSRTDFKYDPANRRTWINDPLGNVIVHEYDERYQVVRERDPLGRSVTYTYDAGNNRTGVTDKRGKKTAYAYDARGNVTSKTDPLGNVTTITYDTKNNPLTRIDALGNTTKFEYDAAGNLTNMTDPLGCITKFAYNAHGQPETVTDCLGRVVTSTYDTEGNLITVTDAAGNVTTYAYDAAGRRISATDARGHTTTLAYDQNDNLLRVTDPLGHAVSSEYDANNNKMAIIDPLNSRTEFAYDPKDRLIKVTDPLDNSVSYTYDALDRRITLTDPRGNTTRYTYDAVGNLTRVTDPLNNITVYGYNPNGNRTSVTDPMGQTTTFTYDALNRLIAARDPLGNTTQSVYDALDRVVRTTDANGRSTDLAYDAMGRLTQVTEPGGGVTMYTYDGVGNRLTFTDSRGNVTTYAYDLLNRLMTETDSLGNSIRYAYDGAGNLITRTDAAGVATRYEYDTANRLTRFIYPDGPGVTFTYDANGNRRTMTDGLGTTTYAYDSLNRITSVTDPFGKTVTYAYDAAGNRSSLTYPDGKAVAYTYDGLNRMKTVTDWLGGVTTYSYDATGNLTGAVNPNQTRAAYSYDASGRLTGLVNQKSDISPIARYTYQPDPVGNLTLIDQTEPLIPFIPEKGIHYSYDADNRLTSATGAAYTYDERGNLTGKTEGGVATTYDYDVESRLLSVERAGKTTRYGYDGLGNRYQVIGDAVETCYILDTNTGLTTVLAETDATGAITAYYVHGLGLISRITPDGSAAYYHYNNIGSAVALTDPSQNISDAYAYDPFGNLTNRLGNTANPFQFVGRYGVMKEGNGLQYIRARYYAPEVGRFIAKDLVRGKDVDGQSLNRYVYAVNNPVRLVDVSGFSPKEGQTKNQYSSEEMLFDLLEVTREIGERGWRYVLKEEFIQTWRRGGYSLLDAKILHSLKIAGGIATVAEFYLNMNQEIKSATGNNIIAYWYETFSVGMYDDLKGLTVNDWLDSVWQGLMSGVTVSWNTATGPVNAAIKLSTNNKYDIEFTGAEINQGSKYVIDFIDNKLLPP